MTILARALSKTKVSKPFTMISIYKTLIIFLIEKEYLIIPLIRKTLSFYTKENHFPPHSMHLSVTLESNALVPAEHYFKLLLFFFFLLKNFVYYYVFIMLSGKRLALLQLFNFFCCSFVLYYYLFFFFKKEYDMRPNENIGEGET